MRIVGGKFRGRKLFEPRGRQITRPTTDRVREACSSALLSALPHGFDSISVLDAFSGSGAFGLEMISRGAGHATFYDIDRSAIKLIRKNIESLQVDSREATSINGDVIQAANRGYMVGSPFDVVILDPPYAFGTQPIECLLHAMDKNKLLKTDAIILFERSDKTPQLVVSQFDNLREKRYGSTNVDILKYSPRQLDNESSMVVFEETSN